MFSKAANKRIRELQLKYETGRLKSGFAAQRKRLILYIFVAVFLFTFAVIFLYFIGRSRRRIISKTDSLLHRKDMEIEYRVRQIQEINAELDSLKKEKKNKKYEGSRLTDKQSEIYLVNLIRFMELEKPYLEEDLTLKELADRTGIPLRDLSRIINEKLHKNFSDFINFYRVEEAKHLLLLEGSREMTILDIAFEVGFNSKSNFNSAFKRHTGITPSLYKKRKDEEAKIGSTG
jgi:AraC-like DNA-binding protein